MTDPSAVDVRVVVAVCTFRRADQLATLLPRLREQASTLDPVAEVVVVDNDPDRSAADVVATHPDVRYVAEPRPGIAAARNAALDAAAAADLLVFLDDDESTSDGWLQAMVAAWRDDRPAAVAGPVAPTFTAPVTDWIRGSGAFRRRRVADGELVTGAGAGNLLLDLAQVRGTGLRFDERFGLTGGEDTVFTHTLVARGGRIRWCDTAELTEPVPADRLTRRWVLRRAYRQGTTWSAMELLLADRRTVLRVRLGLLGKAVVNTARATPPLLWATVRHDAAGRGAAETRIAGQLGLGHGALGGRLQEYGRGPAGRDETERGRTRRTVLVAHPGSELYGSDRVLVETALGLRDAGHRVVVTVPEPGPLTDLLSAQGITCHPCPAPVLRKAALRPGGALALLAATARGTVAGRRLLHREQVGVVLVNTVTVPWWLALARIPPRRRTLCHVHEAERSAPRAVRWALTAPLALADTVVTNSRFSRDVVRASHPRVAARAVLVPNAVPGPAAADPARADLTGGVRLLFVGRLSPRKGPDVAVDALAELTRRGVTARLTLLGSVFTGYEWFAAQLRDTVVRHGLADRVDFAGFDADVWPHLAACDVVLVPSTVDEPFGNTAVEAVLAARPAVVSATSGLLEAADGYRAVVQVPPADPAALADAVERITADWSTFRTAAVDDAATAHDRHDPARYRARMAALVAELFSA